MRSDSGSLLDIGGVECGLIGRKELGACSLDIPYGRLWVQSNADGLGDRVIEQTITGNLRQVAFDDRQDPIWIIEPRDSSDCTWCQN